MCPARRKGRGNPELNRQIAAAKEAKAPVAATFTLKPPQNKSLLTPDETETTVRSIVERVEREVDARAHGINVFPYLQSFAIQAPPAVVERLAAQPEIAAAMPSRPQEDLMIRPVERKEVPGPVGTTPSKSLSQSRKRRSARKR